MFEIAETASDALLVAVDAFSVNEERFPLFTRVVSPLITEVELLLLTRLSEPLMSPAAKSL